jgi:thiosulfate/3-mercaptopyruvate sulfurtransferase
MSYQTLISTAELADNLGNPDWVILDCRFTLADPGQTRRDYLAGHIPGALYAHLEEHLSGPVIPGRTGRHPLPSVEAAAFTFSAWGIDAAVQVVCYDAAGGALAAARAWWLLRWLGHPAAAVLDGGWQKWIGEARPLRLGPESSSARRFIPHEHPEMLVTAAEVERLRLDPHSRLFDARATERFQGRNETIDPVAGHIPGSFSAPYSDNLAPEGTFKSPTVLRKHFIDLLEEVAPEQAVFYCGSGVTALHSVLAMQHAGLAEPRLYPGSWSEWITDPDRPVATGA